MSKLFASLVVAMLVVVPASVSAKTIAAKKTTIRYVSVSAIPGKDEHAFVDSATRCLTKDMIKLNDQSVATMNADIAKFGSEHAQAAAIYQAKMDVIWSAMSQPYCGYGSQGLTAVHKSYIKSFDHVRSEFLAAVK